MHKHGSDTKNIEALLRPIKSLMTALTEGNLENVKYTLPYYLTTRSDIKNQIGSDSQGIIDTKIENAINSISINTPNAKAILEYIKESVVKNPSATLSSSQLGLQSTLQLCLKTKMLQLFPNDAASLKERTSGHNSPISRNSQSLLREGVLSMNSLEQAVCNYDVAQVKKLLQSEIDLNILSVLSQMPDGDGLTTEQMKNSVAILNEFRVYITKHQINDGQIFDQAQNILNSKLLNVRTKLQSALIAAVKFGIENSNWDKPLRELYDYYIGASLPGTDSYNFSFEHYASAIATLGLTSEGKLINQTVAPKTERQQTPLEKITDAIISSLGTSDILSFNYNISLLQQYFLKQTDDPLIASKNFVSVLRSTIIPTENGKGASTLLTCAVRKLDGFIFVSALLHYLQNGIIDLDVARDEIDPLYIASTESRPDMVALLLQYYQANDDFWGSKGKRVQEIVLHSIQNIGDYSRDSVDEVLKSIEVLNLYKKAFSQDQYAVALAQAQARLNEKKINVLVREIKKSFQDPAIQLDTLKHYFTELRTCYVNDDEFNFKLAKHGLLTDVINNPSVNTINVRFALNQLLASGNYATTAAERKALYLGASSTLKPVLLRAFGQYRITETTELGIARGKAKPLTGLDLSLSEIDAHIFAIYKDNDATAEEFNNAVQDLYDFKQTEMCGKDVVCTEHAIKTSVSHHLQQITDEQDTTLVKYFEQHDTYAEPSKLTGINPAVFYAFCEWRALAPMYPIHNKHDALYQGDHSFHAFDEAARWSGTQSGAKWGAGIAALAIVGILIDAYLCHDTKMHERICDVASWTWNLFGHHAGSKISPEHGREMISCVGSVMILAASGLGALCGLAADTAAKRKHFNSSLSFT